jgi:osmotically-inducible protein OsmY
MITSAIESALAFDESVSGENLGVSSVEGVVTLSGDVTNLLEEQRALQVARATKGVRSVIDQIEVQPLTRPDEEIEADVTAAFLVDPAVESYELGVDVQGGVVSVAGTVESWTEKYLATEIVRGIRGVKRVDNNINVDRAEDRADYEIEADIRSRLESDVWVDDALIDVEVKDGVVSLSGVVGSAAEKRRAEWDALIAGVVEVDTDNLDVEWWARDQMRRSERFADLTDAEMLLAVKDALLFDPRVSSVDVEVSVKTGVATLEGTVASLQAKRAAVEDAENTVGVWRVLDYLEVEPGLLVSNDELEALVNEALRRDTYVDSDQVAVEAIGGRVVLEGTVDAQFEKSRAEYLAESIRYTMEVENNLHVDAEWPLKSDSEIRDDIESEIYWNPWLTGAEIEATVEDGVAILEGTVDTPLERTLAEQEALEAGARSVENQLEVRYGTVMEGLDQT